MIFVTPDAYTRFQGSFYGNSVTTGNWEDFIAKELVSYIDSHYRTIPKAESRGLAGHSMGGFGTMRIGQKYPDVFSSIYMLSPGVIKLYNPFNSKDAVKWEAIKTMEDFKKAGFWTNVIFAVAAAWSPNPDHPPFYLDLPVKDGENELSVQAKWIANSPFAALDQYIPSYKRLHAIGFDAGDKDKAIAAEITLLHHELDKYGIRHSFEIYDGDHTNHVGLRIKQNMTPFFSANLTFDK
jgi:enterochelin esterase-like enzyme